MDIIACINNFNYDITWATRLPFPFEVWSNHGIKEGEGTNVCYDIVNYLRYIIQNYNNIHEVTWFLHGHEFGWHHNGKSVVDLVDNAPMDREYYNISLLRNDYTYGVFGGVKYDTLEYHTKIIQMLTEGNGYFDKLIPIKPGRMIVKFNAEFYVTRKLVKRHTVGFYQHLLDVVYKVREKEGIEGAKWCAYIFERLWFYIFTGELIEPGEKFSYIESFGQVRRIAE